MKRKNVIQIDLKSGENALEEFRRNAKVVGFPMIIFGSILEARLLRPISNRGKARPYFSLRLSDVSGKNEASAIFFCNIDPDTIAFPEPDDILCVLGHFNPKFRNILVSGWEMVPDSFRVAGTVFADDPWGISYIDALRNYLDHDQENYSDVSDFVSHEPPVEDAR